MTSPVIALVASRGGLAAVTSVLEPLPDDLDASILVLVHQQPDHATQLPELLASRCPLPVRHGVHDELLVPGHVRVVPPGQHLLVTSRDRVALLPAGDFPPSRPSADLLLVSMALTLGRRAIAVVLSGAGHDGATGAAAVHAFGGRVLAADEASSKEFSMPGATIARPDVVDATLPVSELGGFFARLVEDPTT